MLWFSAARRGLRCSPDRQTLPANDARKGTRRMRFRSQSDPGTRSTTLETGSQTQTWPHPAHLEGDDFTPHVLVLYTTFRSTGRSCTGRQAWTYIRDLDPKLDPVIFDERIGILRDVNSSRKTMDAVDDAATKSFPRYFHFYADRAELLQQSGWEAPENSKTTPSRCL